jgi:hypothetical protein
VAVGDKPLGLLTRPQMSVRKAERAHPGGDQRIALRRAATDRVVLHQDDPASGADVAQPCLVGEALRLFLAVDRRHRVNDQAFGAQRPGEVLAAKAPVYEELRRRLAS